MSRPPRPTQEQLRQQFLQRAGEAFDLMFSNDEDLVTFDQREQRASDLGRTLELELLQQQANHDACADPPLEQVVPCPHCHKPARRQGGPDEPLPPRPLTLASGQELLLRRARFRCTTCRVVFFPPR
jgi:hypothetical protein